MARGHRARLEVFAQALAAGKTPVEAAKIAGYPRGTSFNANARKRAQRADVKAMVAELRAPALAKVQERIEISIEWATQKYLEVVRAAALSDVKVDHYLRALDGLCKLHGLNAPEKLEHAGPDGGPIENVIYTDDKKRAIALANFIAKTRQANEASKDNSA